MIRTGTGGGTGTSVVGIIGSDSGAGRRTRRISSVVDDASGYNRRKPSKSSRGNGGESKHGGTTRKYSSLLAEAMRERYNFKGFGWSINKSLIFPRSVGATFRIPLSSNFDSYEKYRAMPFVTTGAYFGYPWAIAALLNASLPVEAIKWAISGLTWKVRWGLAVLSALTRFVLESIVWVTLWPYRLWGATVRLLGIVGGGGGNTSAATTTGRDEHATSSMSMIDDDIGRTADDGSKYDMDASGEGSIVSI